MIHKCILVHHKVSFENDEYILFSPTNNGLGIYGKLPEIFKELKDIISKDGEDVEILIDIQSKRKGKYVYLTKEELELWKMCYDRYYFPINKRHKLIGIRDDR